MPYLQYAINNNTGQLKLAPVKNFAQEIIAFQQKFSTDSSNLFLLNQIATGYFKMGCREAASKYIYMVLKRDNNNKEALSLLEQIKK
jgi:Tfp pilus assembly protein PilF